MRLTCPNCSAQYDVPDDAIPRGGRDVQCSNCGHTWFYMHPAQTAAPETGEAPADTEGEADTRPPGRDPLPEASPPIISDTGAKESTGQQEKAPQDTADQGAVVQEPAAQEPAAENPVSQVESSQETDQEDNIPQDESPQGTAAQDSGPQSTAPQVVPATVPKRSLDPDMADLFREERDYEAQRRRAETLESQPDLGLGEPDGDGPARRTRETETLAEMRGGSPDSLPPRRSTPPEPDTGPAPAAQETASAPKKDALPDVEELNQSLRDRPEPRDGTSAGRGPATEAPQGGGGFGKGFLLVAVLAALLIGTYAFAPDLSEHIPQAAPYLAGYAEAVDAGRVWLDDRFATLLGTLDAMSSEAEGAGDAAAPEAAGTGDTAPQEDPLPADAGQ